MPPKKAAADQPPWTDAQPTLQRRDGSSRADMWQHSSNGPQWRLSPSPDVPLADSNESVKWKLAIYQADNRALIQTHSLQLVEGCYAVAANEPLAPGVYDVRIEPTGSPPSTWREMLKLDATSFFSSSDEPSDVANTWQTAAWPLIVLPSPATGAGKAPKVAGSPPPVVIRMDLDDSRLTLLDGLLKVAATGESLKDHSDSSTHGWLNWQWLGRNQDDEQDSPHLPASLVSQETRNWQNTLETIQRRLQAVRNSGSTDLWLDANWLDKTDADRLAINSATAIANRQTLIQMIVSEAKHQGLSVWKAVQSNEDTLLVSMQLDDRDTHALPSATAATSKPNTKQSPRWKVLNALRPAPPKTRSWFPPEITPDVIAGTHLVWLGRDNSSTPSEPPNTDATAWMTDWSNFVLQSHQARRQTKAKTQDTSDTVGIVVDEWLINGCPTSASGSIREACLAWASGLLKPSNTASETTTRPELTVDAVATNQSATWLHCQSSLGKPNHSSKNQNPKTASKNGSLESPHLTSLVSIRQVTNDQGTLLTCMNAAPWPMQIVIPINTTGDWLTEYKIPTESNSTLPKTSTPEPSLTLVSPDSTPLGTTILLPPQSVRFVGYSESLPDSQVYLERLPKGRDRLSEITRRVTAVVEHQGMLGKLETAAKLDRLECQSQAAKRDKDDRDPPLWSLQNWKQGGFLTAANRSSKHPTNQTSPSPQTALQQLGQPSLTPKPTHPATKPDNQSPSQPEKTGQLLINGDFESEGAMGLPGWMHAQHPSDAVTLDDRNPSSGRHSVRLAGMTKTGGQAWLISRNLQVPKAGRLGIAIAFRSDPPPAVTDEIPAVSKTTSHFPDRINKSSQDSEPKEPAAPLLLRIAVEGSNNQHPIRKSTTVEVTSSGRWESSQTVLEWLDIDPDRDRDLRLTIDNLSDEPIWIDDVFVTDHFASQQERTELQTLTYLAVQGLQHSDFVPAARLFRNHWAQELLHYSEHHNASPAHQRIGSNPDAESSTKTNGKRATSRSFLPLPAWSDGTPDADSPNFRRPDDSTGKMNAPDRAQSPPLREGGPHADHPQDEAAAKEPKSITARLKSWLPKPLRF